MSLDKALDFEDSRLEDGAGDLAAKPPRALSLAEEMVAIQLTEPHWSRLVEYQASGRKAALRADALDIELIRLGLVEASGDFVSGGPARLRPHAGRLLVARESIVARTPRSVRDELADSFVQWLDSRRRIAWRGQTFQVDNEELMPLARARGVRGVPAKGLTPARADVFSLARTTNPTQIRPAAHVVATTRQDFEAEMRSQTRLVALSCVAETVAIVCPEGLVSKEEVPDGVGLVYALDEGGGFRTVSQPERVAAREPSAGLLMKLLLKRA